MVRDAPEGLEQAANDKSESQDSRFDDFTTEHIIIEDEFDAQTDEPRVVREREYLRNLVQGRTTEITYYQEGFLKVRESNKKKLLKEHTLELRFIDPDPILIKQIAIRCLWSSIALAVLAYCAGLFLPATQIPQYSVPVATALSSIAVLVFVAFVYRSKISHVFCTASGKTDVVTLSGSFGCFRQARNMSVRIGKAVEQACKDSGVHDVRYLRAEMQAHYKLAETGVITREECSEGTTLILGKFD